MQNQRFLRELQYLVGEWSRQNFGDQPSYRPLLGVGEEAGELMHAHLKGEQGIRHKAKEIKALKIDAIGDIVIFLADYCEREGISLASAVEKTWETVEKRIWDAAKKVQCDYVNHKGLPGEWRCQLPKGHDDEDAHYKKGAGGHLVELPDTGQRVCQGRLERNGSVYRCQQPKLHEGTCFAYYPNNPNECGKRISPNIDWWCNRLKGHPGECSEEATR